MNINELSGAELDIAVARALDLRCTLTRTLSDNPGPYKCWLLENAEPFEPSTNWAHGGPIIERERISIEFYGTHWGAMPKDENGHEIPDPDPAKHAQMACRWCPVMATGPTPLIAAMRAFVMSKEGKV